MSACGHETATPDDSVHAETHALPLSTTTFNAIEDARVESLSPDTNFGTSIYLGSAQAAAPDPEKYSYLKFTVASISGTIHRVKLRLYISDATDQGPAIYLATTNSWSESTLTWNNRPVHTGGGADSKDFVPSDSYVDWDVTTLVTGNGTYSFVIVPETTNNMNARSKDDTDPTHHPKLVVTTLAAGESVTNVYPDGDARVDAATPDTNYGSSIYLMNLTGPPDKRSYLKFTVAGVSGAIQQVLLRLYISDATADAPDLYRSANTTWNESTLTWNNQPGTTGSAIGADLLAAASGGFIEYDVSSAVTGNGTYGFVLMPESTNQMNARSADDADPAHHPRLEIIAGGGQTGTPQNLVAEPVSATAVGLCWDPPVGGADGYKVYRNSVEIANVTTTSHQNTTASANTAYTYTVRAYKSGLSDSGNSNIAGATTHKSNSSTGFGYSSTVLTATMNNIGIEMNITGDTDHDATATARYKQAGTCRWKRAMNPLRVDFNGTNRLAGSVLFVNPGTTYDVLVYATDPDGGARTFQSTATTRAIPTMPTGGPNYYVIPGSGGGTGTLANPFQGIAAAQAVAAPGATFYLRAGTYGGRIRFDQGGSSANYVVWRRYQSEIPVLNGIEVAADYLWFEGLTIKDVSGSITLLTTDNDPDYVVVSRCTFANREHSIVVQDDGSVAGRSYGWYIADNTITGINTPGDDDMSGEGVELRDSDGHVVAHNRISNVADGVSYPGKDCDIFGNDIFDASDDGLELDDGRENVRAYRNRLANTDHNAISLQGVHGAPIYIVRNQVINAYQDILKLRDDADSWVDRFVFAHNTIVSSNMSSSDSIQGNGEYKYTLLRAYMRNNIWVSWNGGRMWAVRESADPGPDWRTDIDYDGFDWQPTQPDVFKWLSWYGDLSSFQSASGIEAHAVMIDDATCFENYDVDVLPPASVPAQVLTLKEGCAAIDQGEFVPNLGDGYTGSAPDLGAYERGVAAPIYGPRP